MEHEAERKDCLYHRRKRRNRRRDSLAFAAEGTRLLLAARRAGKLADVASLALELGAEAVHSIDLDVRDYRAVQNAIDALPPEWAEIDVLVNNAGLSRGLEKLYLGKIEDWDEMIDTNVKGLLYVSRAVVPGMVVRKRGHVVNLGSTAGELTYPGGAVYCASKAAERAINDGLRQDLLGTPVRVTSIDPGMVETDFSLYASTGMRNGRRRCTRELRRRRRKTWLTRFCGP